MGDDSAVGRPDQIVVNNVTSVRVELLAYFQGDRVPSAPRISELNRLADPKGAAPEGSAVGCGRASSSGTGRV